MKKIALMLAGGLLTATLSAQEMASVAAPATEALFNDGVKAYNSGSYSKAINLFTEVLARDPEHLNAYLQRGFCHSLQRDYEQAVSDFTEVIRRKPDHLWAFTSRGSALGKWGKQDMAIQDFNRVLELDPRNQEAFNNRGWALKAQGKQAEACKDWHASRKLGNAEAKIILQNNRCK